jgi:hypothetical protein
MDKSAERDLHFGSYRLDRTHEQVWHGRQVVELMEQGQGEADIAELRQGLEDYMRRYCSNAELLR